MRAEVLEAGDGVGQLGALLPPVDLYVGVYIFWTEWLAGLTCWPLVLAGLTFWFLGEAGLNSFLMGSRAPRSPWRSLSPICTKAMENWLERINSRGERIRRKDFCRTQEGPAYTSLFNFHTFVRSFTRSFVRSLVRSLVRSFARLFVS